MSAHFRLARWIVGAAAATLTASSAALRARGPPSSLDLEGLWEAKRRFDPDVRGALVIERVNGTWRATIARREAAVRVNRDTMTFQMPNDGAFVGRLLAAKRMILGHWIQPPLVTSGQSLASPLTVTACGTDCYRGKWLRSTTSSPSSRRSRDGRMDRTAPSSEIRSAISESTGIRKGGTITQDPEGESLSRNVLHYSELTSCRSHRAFRRLSESREASWS